MFGLTFDKIVVLAVIAFFVVGPQKMPYYASQLAKLAKGFRQLTYDARERIRDEIGPDEFDEIDWKKLDPRRYDPRSIIREALTEEVTPPAAKKPPAQAQRPTDEGPAGS